MQQDQQLVDGEKTIGRAAAQGEWSARRIEDLLAQVVSPEEHGRAASDRLGSLTTAGERSGGHNLAGFLTGLEELSASPESGPAPYYLPPPVSLDRLVAAVNTWGIAVLPGALDRPTVEDLNAEFDTLMAVRDELQLKTQESTETACIRVPRKRLAKEGFELTAGLFSSDVFRRIADRIYDGQDYSFNHSVFVHETRPMAAPFSGDLHFDVTRMLKFWVYLEDATTESGAMRALPGSLHWLRPIREDYSNRLVPKADIRNLVDESHHAAVPITGPAGTVFVFDTDMAHGALPVLAGHRRRVIRGHCTASNLLERVELRG